MKWVFFFPVRYARYSIPRMEQNRWCRSFRYQRIAHFLANEDIRKYRKIEILSSRSVREKIEKYLKIQKIRYQSDEFDIEFNREQLASYLGLNRSVLSHELKKMEKDENMLHENDAALILYDICKTVMGLPGCVMYAKRTIFDLVLPRVMAGEVLDKTDLNVLGEGGLCLSCPVCTFPNCGFGK